MADQVPKALFPASNAVAGWSLKSGPTNYTANQLFDYMDGAAEIPKSYDVRSLGSAKYRNAATTLEVAIFDVGSAANAYGYYSARVFLEHSPRSKERIVALDHPAHIYSTVGVFTFWKDRYTVILQPDDGKPDDDSLLQFAKLVSSHIPLKGSEPQQLRRLPADGQVPNSIRYVVGKAAFDATIMFTAKDVFGMSAGPSAVAAEYKLGDAVSTLAVVKYANSEAANLALSNLRQMLAAGKAQPGKSTVPGGLIAITIGRAKAVGAAVHGSELLLSIGATTAVIANKGLQLLAKAAG